MRRILTSALMLGLFGLTTTGLVGCTEESKSTTTSTTSTPSGSTKVTKTEKTENKGDAKTNPNP